MAKYYRLADGNLIKAEPLDEEGRTFKATEFAYCGERGLVVDYIYGCLTKNTLSTLAYLGGQELDPTHLEAIRMNETLNQYYEGYMEEIDYGYAC